MKKKKILFIGKASSKKFEWYYNYKSQSKSNVCSLITTNLILDLHGIPTHEPLSNQEIALNCMHYNGLHKGIHSFFQKWSFSQL